MVKFLLVLLGIPVLFVDSCTSRSAIPLVIDSKYGSAVLTSPENDSLQFSTWLNGVNMLRGAHVFQDKGHLMLIHSLEGLDLVITYSFDPAGMNLSARLVNPAKERKDISDLRLLKIKPGKNGGMPPGFCPGALDDSPWVINPQSSDNAIEYRVDLSSSSLVLLPGEQIDLPALRLEYLPCKDITRQ